MSPDRSGSPTRAASARRGCHCNRAQIFSGDRDGDGQRRRSRRSRRKRRWWRRSAATGPRTAGRRSATAHGRLRAGKNAPAAVLRPPSARPRRRKSRLSCPFGVPQVIRGAQGITPPRQAKIVVNLTSVPWLLVSGLLSHTSKYFSLPAGFYGLKTIFLLLAFMSLSRIKSIEALG